MFKTLLTKTTTMLISTASPATCFAAGTQAEFIFLLWLLQFSTLILLLGLLNKIWDGPWWETCSKKKFSEDLEKQLQGCTMLVELRVPVWPLFSILYHVCICLFSFQGPCLALAPSLSIQDWIFLLELATAEWCEEGERRWPLWWDWFSPWRVSKVDNSLRPTWKPKGSQLMQQNSSGMYSEQKFSLAGRWPLACLPNGCWGQPWVGLAAAIQSGSYRKNYTMFLIQNCLAQQLQMEVFSLLLLPAEHPAKPLNSELNLQIMALRSQPLGSWLLPCSGAFTSSIPARLPSPSQTSFFLLLW